MRVGSSARDARLIAEAVAAGRIVVSGGAVPAPAADVSEAAPLALALPYPPTINTYWRHVVANGRVKVLISERGRAYRKAVVTAVSILPRNGGFTGPVTVEAEFCPPDRRARDLDNLPKALLDALAHAGVFADDKQVRALNTRFGKVMEGGAARVTITPLGEA